MAQNNEVDAIIAANRVEWERLQFLLANPSAKNVFWINCDSNFIKQPLIDALAVLLPTQPPHTVYINAETLSMRDVLLRDLSASIPGNALIHVIGIEHATKNPKFISALNFQRDSFFNGIANNIIIWSDYATASLITHQAYDFWSWLFSVFEFTTPAEMLTQRQKSFPKSILINDKEIRIPGKDSHERIRHLEHEYQELLRTSGEETVNKKHLNDVIVLASALAAAYKEEGKYQQTIDLLQPLWDRYEAILELVNKVSVQSYLGTAFRGAGSYDKAKIFSEQALANSISLYGANHPSVAAAQSNLALVYKALGDFQQAKQLLEQALATTTTIYGANHDDVATCQSNLATVYQDLGDFQQAKQLLEQALATDIANYGANHPKVATMQSNLALVYKALGDLQHAKHLLEQALATDLANYGANHPSVATTQSNLAMVYLDLGDLQQAVHLLEQALATDLANYGANHSTVAITQSNLASVYRDSGNFQQAKQLLELALATDIANYGANHPSVANDQSNLASVYRDLGNLQQAKQLLEQALATDIANYGANHPTVATRQHNLAWVLFDMGAFSEAKLLASQAYETKLQFFGTEHRDTQSTKELLHALQEQGY